MRPRRGGRGQASIEVLALLPILVIAALVAVQAVAMLAAASAAQDDARRRAGATRAGDGGVVTVTGTARPPRVIPVGPRPDVMTVRAGVRAP